MLSMVCIAQVPRCHARYSDMMLQDALCLAGGMHTTQQMSLSFPLQAWLNASQDADAECDDPSELPFPPGVKVQPHACSCQCRLRRSA
jgi:hypothetical protein